MADGTNRDAWGSRLGLILAAAGNAIGIGNLLRFPGQAAQNGGGAFMIPYVVCLLLFGLPMMWVAWSIGRHGGRYGHGSLPGMFSRIWPSPMAKYLGVLGLALPMTFVLYYTYIEAWCLGYAVFSFQGDYANNAERTVHLGAYFNQFLGDSAAQSYFHGGVRTAFIFMGITLVLNLFVLSRGVAKGIEVLAKVAIPLLFLFCTILAVRVFTYEGGEGSAWDGLNYLWTPDFSKLTDTNVWMSAAGQIFFTLSIGFGALECYASYVKENEDIALTGLTTAATNEFVEVIFGSMIAIPAIAVFYGAGHLETEGDSYGTFALGMIALPEILRTFPYAEVFGGIWFLLLFFAAFTSSVAVAQPVMAFFQDEMKKTRLGSTFMLAILWILGVIPVILFGKYGMVDELDLWAGKIGLVVVALVEVILFSFVWKTRRGWPELMRGAMIKVPGIFKFIVVFVTPALLAFILASWTKESLLGGQLTPTPKYDMVFGNPEKVPADGALKMDNEGPAEGEADKAWQAHETTMTDLSVSESGDGELWMTIAFGADGSATVQQVNPRGVMIGNPHAEQSLWQRYVADKGLMYTEDGAPAAMTTTVVARALNRAPYIWLARGIIGFFFVVFLILIFVAFRGRDLSVQPEGA